MSLRCRPEVLVALVCASPAAATAQEARAVLDAPLVVTEGHRLGTLADLDGDGYEDALGWWWTSLSAQSVRISVYRNDRQGGLAPTGHVDLLAAGGGGPSGLVRMRPCDVDHDGRTDFSFLMNQGLSSGHSSLHVFAANGDAAPRLVPTYTHWSGGTARMGAVLEDLDGDGTTDLVLAVGTELRVYSYAPVPGGDPVGTLRATIALPAPTDDLFAIDANGDARPDVYANMGGTGWIVPILDFQPASPVVVPHGVASMPMPAAGDVDGDGDQDLVVFDMTQYVVLRRVGRASWSLEAPVAGGPATNLYDVDQDGDLDGVCCGGGDPDLPRNDRPSTFRVSINDGTGRFAPAFEFPGLGSDHMAGAADLDHDGDLDLVAGRCVYYARGPITRPVMPLVASASLDRASAADLDRDGDPDFRPGVRSVRRNLGTGECQDSTPMFPPQPPGTTDQAPGFHGDFDGDGDVDVLTQRWSGPLGSSSAVHLGAWLYRNSGGGTFVDAGRAGDAGDDFAHAGLGMVPERCLVADADDDGDLDLLVLDYLFGPTTSIRRNDGQGRFFGPAIVVTGYWAVAVGDIDGDGRADLLCRGSNLGIPVLLGQRAGAFTPGPILGWPEVVYSAGSLALADLDADGDLDVAVAATRPNLTLPPEIYWNQGAGTFLRETLDELRVEHMVGGRAASATDWNGDGLLDLVLGPVRGAWSAAYILLRRADNTGYEPPVRQTLYAEHAVHRALVFPGTAVDVDGDGDTDHVTDRVIRNPRHHGARHGRRLQATDAQPGGGGVEPTLGATGPFPVGSTTTLRLTGACVGANGLLTAGWLDRQQPVFGGGGASHQALGALRLTSQVPFTTSGTPGLDGAGEWSLTYAVPAYKAGRTYVYRATIDDPAVPSGRSVTNRLFVTYGL